MTEQWFEAARRGQISILRSLSNICLRSKDSSGNTALMLVVQNDHSECLKMLEEEATMTNNAGMTALGFAIICRNNTACAFLAPMESHINLPYSSSPLKLAAKMGNCDAINCLTPYANEPFGKGLETSLTLAVRENSFTCTKLLLTRLPYTMIDICNELATSNIDIKILLLERCELLLECEIGANKVSSDNVSYIIDQYQQRISFLKDMIHCLKLKLQETVIQECNLPYSNNLPTLEQLQHYIQECHIAIKTLKQALVKSRQNKTLLCNGYQEKLHTLQDMYKNTIESMQLELQSLKAKNALYEDTANRARELETTCIGTCTIVIKGEELSIQTEKFDSETPYFERASVLRTVNSAQQTPTANYDLPSSYPLFVDAEMQTEAPEFPVLSASPQSDTEEDYLTQEHLQLQEDNDRLQNELLLKNTEIQTLTDEVINLQASIERISATGTRALTAKDLELEQEIQIFTERISFLSEENVRLEQVARSLREDNATLMERLHQAKSELLTARYLPTDTIDAADEPTLLLVDRACDPISTKIQPSSIEMETQTNIHSYLVSVAIGNDQSTNDTSSSPGIELLCIDQFIQTLINENDISCQTDDSYVDIMDTTTVLRQELDRAYQQLDNSTLQRASRTSVYTETVERVSTAEDLDYEWSQDYLTLDKVTMRCAELERLLKEKDDRLARAHEEIKQLTIRSKSFDSSAFTFQQTNVQTTPYDHFVVNEEASQSEKIPTSGINFSIELPNNDTALTLSTLEKENSELREQLESLRQTVVQLTNTPSRSSTPKVAVSHQLLTMAERLCVLSQQLKDILDTTSGQTIGIEGANTNSIKRFASEISEQCVILHKELCGKRQIFHSDRQVLPSTVKEEVCDEHVQNTNTELMESAIINNVEVASVFLHQVRRTNLNGDTALMIAAKFNSIEVAKLLVKYEANCIRKDGMTALAIALYNKNLEMATFLKPYEGIDIDAQVEGAEDYSTSSPTALIFAARRHNVVVVWSLLETHARYQDKQGRTALMHAAEYGFDIIVHLLVSYEAGMRDIDGYTGLMIAANSGHVPVILELRDYEVRLQCARGYTALMYAAAAGHKDVVAALAPFEAGMQTNISESSLINQPGQNGSPHSNDDTVGITALMLAVETGSVDCVDILWPLEHHICDGQGLGPIHYACSDSIRNLLRSYQ